MYALKFPSGKLVTSTLSHTREECWGKSFDHVAYAEGTAWRSKFWKRWNPSLTAAKKKGYKMVKVKLVEC